MNLVEFLTSKEIIVVYIVTAVACLLCFIIYLVEKNNNKALKRHNTKELNKLVEEVQEEVEINETEEVITPQIVETIDVTPIVEEIKKEEIVEEETIEPIIEDVKEVNLELEENTPSIEEAKEILQEVKIELEKQEQSQNIDLTTYEEEQEENAIISLEELVKKGKEIYDANEIRETTDDVNAPISLHELEIRVGKTATNITDTFIIENVVSEEELDSEPVIINNVTLNEEIKEEKETGFIPTPFISPVYGIEKELTPEELELENTADYEKLDKEIKKTNEFLMTLRELQSKLD